MHYVRVLIPLALLCWVEHTFEQTHVATYDTKILGILLRRQRARTYFLGVGSALRARARTERTVPMSWTFSILQRGCGVLILSLNAEAILRPAPWAHDTRCLLEVRRMQRVAFLDRHTWISSTERRGCGRMRRLRSVDAVWRAAAHLTAGRVCVPGVLHPTLQTSLHSAEMREIREY